MFEPASQIVKTVYTKLFQGPDDYNPHTEWQEQFGGYEYSTYGPGNNEGVKKYSFGGGSHNIRYVHFMSPDILLVHQSKMVGFYIKMAQGGILKPIDRSVKNQLIKDTSIPRQV